MAHLHSITGHSETAAAAAHAALIVKRLAFAALAPQAAPAGPAAPALG